MLLSRAFFVYELCIVYYTFIQINIHAKFNLNIHNVYLKKKLHDVAYARAN
jgi:hypothetical protein